MESLPSTAVRRDPRQDWPEERKRTAVAKHPDSEYIEALMRRGKSAWWISSWLEDCYPLDDPESDEDPPAEHPEAALHRKLHVGEKTLEAYRRDWLPQYAPGVDIVIEDISEVIGRRFPGFEGGPLPELEIIDMAGQVAQHNLALALQADANLEMLTETALDAQAAVVETASKAVEIKTRLGVPGYEPLPEHHIVESTNRNVNIELDGRTDPRTGQRTPVDPGSFGAVMDLLKRPADEVERILAAGEFIAAHANDDVIEAHAEEEVSDGPGASAGAEAETAGFPEADA